MKTRRLSVKNLVILSMLPVSAWAGIFSFTNLSSDEDTGINATKIYTHLVDFGSDAAAATINGVRFTAKGKSGTNYSVTNTGGDFVNNTQGNLPDGLGDLFSDFFYGGDGGGVQVFTLTGLKEAHTYRLTFFVAGWAGASVDFSGSDAPGVKTLMSRAGTSSGPDGDNQLPTGAGQPGAAIQYEFIAPASGNLVLTLDAVSAGDTFHHYGFTNEQIGTPNDGDGDGMPDIYEQANGLNPAVKDSQLDLDADGLKNIDEYDKGTKANNPDTDADGLKDGVETKTGTYVSATNTGTDPLAADTDGDGLQDGAETNTGTFLDAARAGTNPHKTDSDNDGFSDGFEITSAFNPNLASSTPESATSLLTAVEFRFNAANGVGYRIEGSANLVGWTTVEANIQGNGGQVTRFYSIGNQNTRFFRAVRN